MIYKLLTVNHYGDLETDNRRMTISPSNIAALAADHNDVTLQGRSLRKVSVCMMDGGTLDLTVNHADLALMEEAVGAFPDFQHM